MSDNDILETRQRHTDKVYPFVSVKDAHYWTCAFDVEANGKVASVIGNCAHGGHLLPSGNKIEIFVDGEIVVAVPMSKWTRQGFMPTGLMTAMLAEIEWHVIDGLEHGWYRPPQINVTGNDDSE